MSAYEVIFHTIESWRLSTAKELLSQMPEVSDSELRQLDKMYREYDDVDERVKSLHQDLSDRPEAVLLGLEKLPSIKFTHPHYQSLFSAAKEGVDNLQRLKILERINKADELSRFAKYYAEAQQELQAVRDSYPNWASDTQISKEIHRVDDEAKKAEKASILIAGIEQDKLLGKPDEALIRLGELQLLDKLSLEDIEEYRNELNRLVAHKHGRSSKDKREFSGGEEEIVFEIDKIERSVSSITNLGNYSYRLLLNNKILQQSLYRSAIGKLAEKKEKEKKRKEVLIDGLEVKADGDEKTELVAEIAAVEEKIGQIDTQIEEIKEKLGLVNSELPSLQNSAVQQINQAVEESLGMAEKFCESGQLSMALFSVQTAQNAGKEETYEDDRLVDHLGQVPLQPEQVKRIENLQSQIKLMQEQRKAALTKVDAAQKRLSDHSLTLPQLQEIFIDLNNVRALDKNTPGLTSLFEYLEERITRETKLQCEQFELRISLLCQKGLVDEAQRIYDQALKILGDNEDIEELQEVIKTTQKKVFQLEKNAEEFQALFAVARENLATPDPKMRDLLQRWSREGFDTIRIAAANARFEQYVSGQPSVKQIFDLLMKGLQSGRAPAEMQSMADELRQCFLSRESVVQELLADFWQVFASQYKDKDPRKEEELLQEALGYAENSKKPKLVAKIQSRLKELQDLTEFGRKARQLEEELTRHRERDLSRALEKIAQIAADDPLRNNPRIARLIDDIDYDGKSKRAVDFYQKARELYNKGETDSAQIFVKQALEVLPNHFEAIQLQGEIVVIRADEQPIIERIKQAIELGADAEIILTSFQVKILEETKYIADQLDSKNRISMELLALKKQFKTYFDVWYSRMQGIVDAGISNIKIEINAGDFDKAGEILADVRKKGIPSDLLALISDAENNLKELRAKSESVKRLLEQAVEKAKEGKIGLQDAINLLTPLRNRDIVPLHLEAVINDKLNTLKIAQQDFGKITTETEDRIASSLSSHIKHNGSKHGLIDFEYSASEVNSLVTALKVSISKLNEIGIKDNNLVWKSVLALQEIASWYVNSIDVIEQDSPIHNYAEISSAIQTLRQRGEELKNNLPAEFPPTQVIQTATDNHISLLGKIRQNNDIFASVYKEVSSYGRLGWPNKNYWQVLRSQLNEVFEKLHTQSDVRKVDKLIKLINQKEEGIFRNWLLLAIPSGLIVFASLIGLIVSSWRGYIAPTYFPTPTFTLTPSITPTITPTGTATPIPSITPRPTVTPTPTPLPVLARVMWQNGGAVFIEPGVFKRVYTYEANSELFVQAYCVRGNKDYWGRVLVPNDYQYGWIRLAEFNEDTNSYYDYVNADLTAGLRAEPVATIMNAHPELLVDCP